MSVVLQEAFKELELLDEDVFDISTDGVEKLKAFDDTATDDLEVVIDAEAETEDELQDSYIGKCILECDICKSKIYKDPEDIVINEEEELANIGEACPYCQSDDGYKIIGQVAEFKKEEPEVETEDEVKVEVEDKEDLEESKKSLDDIDADMDDKKEKAKNEYEKEKDDARSDRDYQVKKNLKEEIENVSIETEDQVITVNTEDKEEEKSEDEMIVPVSEETKEEIKSDDDYEDIDIDEFDETEFDELGEKYLRNVYENVKSFKTTSGKLRGNKINLEGLITFKSGKQGKTNFIFEAKTISKTGKLKFIGENKQFAKGNKTFTLTGKLDGKKLISESLTYNYRGKDQNGNSKRLYGTVARSK